LYTELEPGLEAFIRPSLPCHIGQFRLVYLISQVISSVVMNPKKIAALRGQLNQLRRQGGIKGRELEGFAKALGRERHKRGSEPTWVSTLFKDIRPVSIPSHAGRDLNRNTAGSILNQLEEDLERLEEIYCSQRKGEDYEE